MTFKEEILKYEYTSHKSPYIVKLGLLPWSETKKRRWNH